MTILGMPMSMFLVFLATIIAGSLGAVHYLIVHIILKRPFGDEGRTPAHRDPGARTAIGKRGAGEPKGGGHA